MFGQTKHFQRRYDPLKVFINDEGLVRFATELYSDAVETLQSRKGAGGVS